MWGVNPEARGWNVGAVCSDFNLGECISRKSPRRTLFGHIIKRPNKVHWGLFLQIRSAKIKSEQKAPTLQLLDSELTPPMPMFGRHEIFTL